MQRVHGGEAEAFEDLTHRGLLQRSEVFGILQPRRLGRAVKDLLLYDERLRGLEAAIGTLAHTYLVVRHVVEHLEHRNVPWALEHAAAAAAAILGPLKRTSVDHLDVVLEALVAQALALDAGEALGDLEHHVAARAEQIGCVLTHMSEHVCSKGCVATTHLNDLQRLTRI